MLATPDRDAPREAAGLPPVAPLRVGGAGEALARRALRAQIARLETDLAAQAASARRPATFAELVRGDAKTGDGTAAMARTVPRLLSLGELEAQRDDLAARLADERADLALLADRQEGFRQLREEMLLDPAAYPDVRVSNADVGEPGCLDWHVRPNFGPLGRLMRWWRVKISSGCP
ncbi:MAG TPA: hypothetical protein VF517_00715 [Thermoleophilaceae bacterium]